MTATGELGGGVKAGGGFGGSLNLSEQVSSGNCVGDLAKRFYDAGGSIGYGGGVTGDAFKGAGSHGQTVYGGSGGFGIDLGAEVHGGPTYTLTTTLIGKGCGGGDAGTNEK